MLNQTNEIGSRILNDAESFGNRLFAISTSVKLVQEALGTDEDDHNHLDVYHCSNLLRSAFAHANSLIDDLGCIVGDECALNDLKLAFETDAQERGQRTGCEEPRRSGEKGA